MYQFIFRFLLVVLFTTQAAFVAAEVKRENFPDQAMVQLQLENGMKVVLKQTNLDEEVEVRVTALGGYAALPPDQRASGQYATQTALRSGVGPYDFDKFSAILYDHAIEFNSQIQPFSRVIDGTAHSEEVDTLLNLIYLYFTQYKFDEISFKKVLEKAKEQISRRSRDSSLDFEDAHLALNTQNLPALRPLTVSDIERADFKIAKNFFSSSFVDPSEFVCVIVGKFDMEKMIASVSKNLSRIPPLKEHRVINAVEELPQTKQKIQGKVIKNNRSKTDAMTRITFPLKAEITESNYLSPEKLALMLNIRLKKVLTDRYGKDSIIINVCAEYPLYPYFRSSWISVHYISEPKYTDAINVMILSELEKMQKEGINEEEIVIFQRKFKKSQRLKQMTNEYLSIQLSNFMIRNWNPEVLSSKLSPDIKKEEMHRHLQNFLSLENYNTVTAKP